MFKTSLIILAGVAIGIAAFLFGRTPAPSTDLGATPGQDISQNCTTVGGLQECTYRVAMRQNASTTCSFTSPAATSSLRLINVKIASSTTGASIVEIGSDPNSSFATTTLIGTTYAVGAANQAAIVGSTTPTNGNATLFAPKTRINIKVGNWAPLAPVGTCEAKFITL